MQTLSTEVLVVGGGTGGTAAAIQAARRGAQVILVSEFAWLGGMLTSAGVVAPDGNELAAWQTGIWGAFLQELQQRQPGGLDHAWVSFFTYEPQIGAAIFADWVQALPNLTWIVGQTPTAVLRSSDRILGVQFQDYAVQAQITIDGTELGDLLALGDIPHRWGWELKATFQEPSAPSEWQEWMTQYPVQAPTWVVILQDFGQGTIAPKIPQPPHYDPFKFAQAWENYGSKQFLNYGRLPGDRFMMNWPIHGNDYGEGLHRLIESPEARQEFLQEAFWHSQGFAYYIQNHIDPRYGLAIDIFPHSPTPPLPHSPTPPLPHSPTPPLPHLNSLAFALHPYYRESRRLIGMTTVREQDILPIASGQVAALPFHVTAAGCANVESLCSAIALGNYVNDHHYPSGDIPLKPKAIRWGGRWTGTPFTIPYGAIVPALVDGLLVCEKNISVTHMANGATRLQPLVLGIGQAAGMAAALAIEQQCPPRHLPVRSVQNALITDPTAPAAIIPLFNLDRHHPEWLKWQTYYLDHPEAYPGSGYAPCASSPVSHQCSPSLSVYSGTVRVMAGQEYQICLHSPPEKVGECYGLVCLQTDTNEALKRISDQTVVKLLGQLNPAGRWILVDKIEV
ncbi:MAG: FAD-dependent oxidoreductase [Synechococcales bacterium]|nr:FAD-dependent oxidoreductase [Synechococcales bacterium]